ncbi:exosortase A [Sphingosinicella sp. LHD-64]|uniref:exosortase A n=1 Tax=Sphingosinicella sp. LHD-64 TaxID=3072139 RepID=UPI00280E6372|nr:exosortase A [Sphingosinicella sp. LHD-64]MDQ8754689.1 exosortase A [Sphingosinicella sp. LHD-64]
MTLAVRLDAAAVAGPWRTHLVALGAAAAAILALFHRDAADVAAIWWSSSTFNHCLLIPPIIAWLVWQRVPGLRQLTPTVWAPGLALAGLGALGWLLGDAGGLALARHAGLVLMLQGAIIACLGRQVSRALAFPIFYALFLIPAGEELVPAMQTVTAEISMALLALAGVPAHIEGIFITTPTGYFEVAEACAGVKFLIAMAAFGALVANVCFRSWPRRIAFMAVALVVPILANGVRAFATIYVAHRTGSVDLAAGFDHVVYGGIFFAIVIALILALSWRFFDRGPDDPWFDAATRRSEQGRTPIAVAAAATVLIAAFPVAWSAAVSAGARPVPATLTLPDVPGWQRVPARGGIPWRPHFAGADLFRMARYRDRQGREVDLAIAVYARQLEGRELIGFGQGAVGPDSAWAWTAGAPAPLDGRAERIASHGLVREVVSFYRVGGITSGSGMAVKLETMKVRLIGGPQRAVAVLASAPALAEGVSPRPAIDAFLAALGPVAPFADRAAGLE